MGHTASPFVSLTYLSFSQECSSLEGSGEGVGHAQILTKAADLPIACKHLASASSPGDDLEVCGRRSNREHNRCPTARPGLYVNVYVYMYLLQDLSSL